MKYHNPVLLQESIQGLAIKPNGVYVDATFGGGGHARAIIDRLDSTGKLIAFDTDHEAKLNQIDDIRFQLIPENFRHIKRFLRLFGVKKADGIIADLGVSSHQFDSAERGFSTRFEAQLDMRMNQDQELTAEEIVNEYSFHDIMHLLQRYGEEKNAKLIARKIELLRKEKPIKTTFDLVAVIKSALPSKVLNKKGHPAKKTFQALRIAVNDELQVFEKSLEQAFDLINPEGRIVVITFHSLEDRIAKTMMKEKCVINVPLNIPVMPDEKPEFELLHRKVILPTEEELLVNNRAHSAKLRAIKKL